MAAVDLDDDGIVDVVVGAPSLVTGGALRGGVFVFFGPLSGNHTTADADVTILGEELRDGFESGDTSAWSTTVP